MLEFGLPAQRSLYGGGCLVAQLAIGLHARIHDGRLHHEQAREAAGQQASGEQKVGGTSAMSDAENIPEVERLDHGTDVRCKIQE